MDVTVLICTWNRAEKLRMCLTSLLQLEVPAGLQWEIVVVNNHCTDDTSQIIGGFIPKLPLREVLELQLGLSQARNTGIQNAQGDLILFFDDDVIIESQTLSSFLESTKLFPQGALFGGKIEPQMASNFFGCDSILSEPFFDGLVLRKDLGPQTRMMESQEYFFGANFAVKKEVFNQIRFDVLLGKNGHHQIAGEEVKLQKEAMSRGLTRVWVPQAKVTHPIEAERIRWRASGRYFWGLGRTYGRLGHQILFPRLEKFSFFGSWAQASFLAGYLFELLSFSKRWRGGCT